VRKVRAEGTVRNFRDWSEQDGRLAQVKTVDLRAAEAT
jgi:hypothetical protein